VAETVDQAFGELAALLERSAAAHAPTVEQIAARFTETLRNGGTLYFGGNGGSAADAQHCAAEYVVRYSHRHADRPA
jgi:phosphoheptose isomerase